MTIAPKNLSRDFSSVKWLSCSEQYGLIVFFVFVALFGALVEVRSAFLKRRMTDLGVYLRAAWAVRTGQNIYAMTDDNGWHYHYPPLFAILLAPLADPPPNAERTGTIPFAVTVALWYTLSVLAVFWGTHKLGTALEQTSPDTLMRAPPRGCRQWWLLRVLPVLVCLPSIGRTLARGQVDLLLLALLCGMIGAALRGHPWQAGLWLAGAISLKIFPAFMLSYPLLRRDIRWLAGCALGLFLGLGLIPAVVFGPSGAWAYQREWTQVALKPAFIEGADPSRAKERFEMTNRHDQSLQAVLHNTLHPRVPRPPYPSPVTRWIHWLVGGLLIVLTFLAAGRPAGQIGTLLCFGALMVVMVLINPFSHIHYFCLSLPLVTGLVAANWELRGAPNLGTRMKLLLWAYVLASTLPSIPGLELLRDLGLAMYASLSLWLAGILVLWRVSHSQAVDRPLRSSQR